MFTYAQRQTHFQLKKMADHILEHGIQHPEAADDTGIPASGCFRVTQDWIRANATPAGGYKNEQVRLIGLRYPLKHGWSKQCEGRIITNEAKIKFEAFHAGYKATKKSRVVMGQTCLDDAPVARCDCDVLPWEDCIHTGQSSDTWESKCR